MTSTNPFCAVATRPLTGCGDMLELAYVPSPPVQLTLLYYNDPEVRNWIDKLIIANMRDGTRSLARNLLSLPLKNRTDDILNSLLREV